MIFITKKAFENKMYERISEANFHARTEDELYKLKDEVRELKYRLDALEGAIRQPVPVNPATFKMPEVTCASPYQTTCTTSNEVKSDFCPNCGADMREANFHGR